MSSDLIDKLAEMAGVTWFDYQVQVLEAEAATDAASLRACLYYRTGAGKSITALALVAQAGVQRCVVIAPPSTHDTWVAQGRLLGIDVEAMSHAKFRMKDTKLDRKVAVIADEFHLFGGHGGKGWAKLDRLARGLQAPLILASATPNYNDADRVYCIQHILDPHGCKGGFLEFLYRNCNTLQNPYGMVPLVDEEKPFLLYQDAAEYLAALPHVYYVEDNVVYTIDDEFFYEPVPDELMVYGLNRRKHKLIASQMEKKHAVIDHQYCSMSGILNYQAWSKVVELIERRGGPVIVFAEHETVAAALGKRLARQNIQHEIVSGKMTKKQKLEKISRFRNKEFGVLVGTASLATGTDGLDKVCDTLIILDDTEDDSLRRQLIGRIMPRGAYADATKKKIYRLIPV